MGKTICFWNTEHLSPRLVEKARRTAERLRLQSGGVRYQQARTRGRPVRPVTRGMVDAFRRAPIGIAKPAHHTRATTGEIARRSALLRAENKYTQIKHKFDLSQALLHSAPYVFYCEVMQGFAGVTSSLPGPAGPHTLCYAHFANGTPVPLAGVLAGGALPGGVQRVPKATVIQDSKGNAVQFCFWHAPSGNNGQVVIDMFNALAALWPATPFVLFGDLNAEPSQLAARGFPRANILLPNGQTRISKRKLDYALSNRPDLFHPYVRAYRNASGLDIKNDVGSDHMVMFLDLK